MTADQQMLLDLTSKLGVNQYVAFWPLAKAASEHIAKLETELASAREDSERIEWLDENMSERAREMVFGFHYRPGAVIRAAIDAARGQA